MFRFVDDVGDENLLMWGHFFVLKCGGVMFFGVG